IPGDYHMATVTPPAQHFDRGESHRRVRHPLERLRGTIRTYVGLEALASLLLYLGLWFWIGLLLDYGVFKAFTIDSAPGAPRRVPPVVLLGLGAGLLARVVVKGLSRLRREFRASALGLVLERRFPRLLGDRLITAVELGDPRLAEHYGYSQAMIDHTLEDA